MSYISQLSETLVKSLPKKYMILYIRIIRKECNHGENDWKVNNKVNGCRTGLV